LHTGGTFGELVMWRDEIVEDVRKVREEYAEKFNHDLEAIYQDLKKQEREGHRKVVSLPPKEPEMVPHAKAS
jgi:hypothetical protein